MKKFLSILTFLIVANATFAAITFTPTAIDSGYCKQTYYCKITATGGTAPYAYTVTSGSLPSGLKLDKASGVLSGILNYTDSTSVTFTVQAKDKKNVTATKVYTMYITNQIVGWADIVGYWQNIPNTFPSYGQIYNTWRLNTGGGSSYTIDVTKTAFVSETGNDATAQVGDPGKPFLTFIEAQNACSAGSTIYVYPGNYTGSGLGKDSVDYYFCPQSYITNSSTTAVFTDAGTVRDFNVYGFGNFISNGPILLTYGSFNGTFELQNGSCNFNQRAFYARGGTVQKVLLRGTLSHTGYAGTGIFEALLRSDNNGAGSTGGKIYISGGGSIQSQGFVAQTKQGSTHNGKIVISVAGGCTMFATAGVRCFAELNGGSIIFNCDIVAAGTSAFGLPVFRTEDAFNDLIFNGKITSTCTDALLNVSVSGNVEINNAVTSTSNIQVSGASAILTINGNVTTNVAATSALSISNGTARIKGILKNADTDGSSHVVLISGGTLIVQNGVLVSSGAGNSISAATAQNALIYSGYANTSVDSDVTQIVDSVKVNASVQ